MIADKYYIKVNRNKISICLDSDIMYYHHFEIGDIFEITFGDIGCTMEFKGMNLGQVSSLKLDWDMSVSATVPIDKLLEIGHLIDVTKMVRRNYLIDDIIS